MRVPPRRAVRDSGRHQLEKDNAILPETERGELGEAETNLAMSITDQEFSCRYDVIPAPADTAAVFGITPTTPLLCRRYTSTDPKSGNPLSSSVSYIPKSLVEGNPAIMDEKNEPWPGGTLHQLSTVGIEITKVVDEVTARMPSSAEGQDWDLPPGIPLLLCRRLSYDQAGTLIEISDAWYPADRTELRFTTPLTPWTTRPRKGEAPVTTLTTADAEYLRIAIDLSRHALDDQRKTPFGAILVLDDEVISRGTSSVIELVDPTAHAEVMAIRNAARKLGRHLLDGSTLYSSSEPCPLCLTPCYWAHVSRLVFGATSYDVATNGFEDLQLYRELATDLDHRSLPEVSAGGELRDQAANVLRGWADNFPEPVTPKY